jgi:beta-glucanase (GH16 family)
MTDAVRHAFCFGCALSVAVAAACGSDDEHTTDASLPQTTAAVGGSAAGASGRSNGSAGSGGQTSSAAGRTAQPARAGATAGKAASPPPAAGQEDAGQTPPPSDAGKPDASLPPMTGTGTELPGWKLVWNDEFEGAQGTRLDPSRWVYETGGSGWGNNQLEFDTDRAENASLDGKGELSIVARKESYMGKNYTSVRLKTQDKFEHVYGRYEIRTRLPFGQGIWPAFWMLGVDPNNVGWPARGEIDIMENIGREPDTIHGTLHGPGYSGANGVGASSKLAAGARFADDYHVFAIEWEKDVIRWYVDGKLYQTRKPSDLPNGSKWVYDHPFFLLLNLAVGGQWPGNPNDTTTFPQTMKVDYVRVYDRVN